VNTDLVTGDVPSASGYFNPLKNQTIIPCTSGTRPSSPTSTMVISETDTGIIQRWNGSSWRPVAGPRTLYTPALQATITNPVLGTGSSAQGWYTYVPEGIVCDFFIKFGTSGATFGAGNYQVTLPITAAIPFGSSNHSAVGTIQLGDVSTSLVLPGCCFVDPTSPTRVGVISATGIASTTTPWTWATGDYVSGSIFYPV
jgi:hypothetical protein